MFNIFKSSKDAKLERIVIGYLRRETSNQLGVDPSSKEFDDYAISSGELMKVTIVPFLDKQLMQEVADTLNSVATNRFNEMLGEFMLQLYTRFCLMSVELGEGKLTHEEALLSQPNNLAKVLHEQIKNLIKQQRKPS